MALTQGTRSVLEEHIRQGDPQTLGEFAQRAAVTAGETLKGFTVGAGTGAAGKLAGLGAGAAGAGPLA